MINIMYEYILTSYIWACNASFCIYFYFVAILRTLKNRIFLNSSYSNLPSDSFQHPSLVDTLTDSLKTKYWTGYDGK